MKKIYFLLFITFTCMFFSCSSDKKNDALIITNNIDQMVGWAQNPSIIKGESHSGNYMCKVDAYTPYSFGLSLSSEDFPTKKAKSVKASVWGKLFNQNDSISLVVELVSKGQFVGWTGIAFSNAISNTNEWGKVEVSLDIPKNIPAETFLRVYVWSTKKTPAYGVCDDFEISCVE